MLDHPLPGIPGGPGGPGGPTMPLNSDPEMPRESKELVMAGARELCQTTWTDVPCSALPCNKERSSSKDVPGKPGGPGGPGGPKLIPEPEEQNPKL